MRPPLCSLCSSLVCCCPLPSSRTITQLFCWQDGVAGCRPSSETSSTRNIPPARVLLVRRASLSFFFFSLLVSLSLFVSLFLFLSFSLSVDSFCLSSSLHALYRHRLNCNLVLSCRKCAAPSVSAYEIAHLPLVCLMSFLSCFSSTFITHAPIFKLLLLSSTLFLSIFLCLSLFFLSPSSGLLDKLRVLHSVSRRPPHVPLCRAAHQLLL